MRLFTQIGLVVGLVLLISLLVWQGFVDVLNLLAASGWWLLLLPLIWLPSLFIANHAWLLLFPEHATPRFMHGLLATWTGRAVNGLLPVATIGGEIVKARLLAIRGYASLDAAASVMVDKAVQALAVALWGCVGVVTLLYIADDTELVQYAGIGFVILIVSAIVLMRIQHLGLLGLLAKLGGKLIKTESWEGLTLNAQEADARVRSLYRNRYKVVACLAYRCLSLALQTLEVWLACYLLGRPISLPEAVMLKSLTSTLSDIAFIIPSAYGVQEGAFILIGALIGLDPELCLAVSLALRIRDLLLDPAGLLYLHRVESRHYSQRRLQRAQQPPES
ncbi:MAG: lysylphosphatidylglycerol synthase domain-containing protein [Gammaproteobacteria bacterium]